MTKRWWFVTWMVLALLAASAAPALAQSTGPGPGPVPPPKPFTLQGIVKELAAPNITVQVLQGNAAVGGFVGKPLLVETDSQTKFFRITDLGMQEIAFADLALEDQVLVNGRVRDGHYLAQRVVAKPPRPVPFSLSGKVTSLAEGAFTVAVQKGAGAAKSMAEVIVAWNAETLFYRADPSGPTPIAPSELKVGDLVQVTGAYSGGQYLAKRVLVKPPRPMPFWVRGEATAVGTASFQVEVLIGRGALASQAGQVVEIFVNDETLIQKRTVGGVAPLPLSELQPGDKVNVAGMELDGVYTAKVVWVLP
ncbi:MAG: hypothetical protein GX605_12725 [Chloroflexi bacterium]|nr:hypothetical protein [Chloroflexota bacterium]